MAVRTWGAFAAGVAVGWGARSVLGSGRELVVRSVVVMHRVRGAATRTFAEQVEWLEDMFAEGRARHEAESDPDPVDEVSHARVARDARDHAA